MASSSSPSRPQPNAFNEIASATASRSLSSEEPFGLLSFLLDFLPTPGFAFHFYLFDQDPLLLLPSLSLLSLLPVASAYAVLGTTHDPVVPVVVLLFDDQLLFPVPELLLPPLADKFAGFEPNTSAELE